MEYMIKLSDNSRIILDYLRPEYEETEPTQFHRERITWNLGFSDSKIMSLFRKELYGIIGIVADSYMGTKVDVIIPKHQVKLPMNQKKINKHFAQERIDGSFIIGEPVYTTRYTMVYIPKNNMSSIDEAVETGVFRADINFDSIRVLEEIFFRSLELKHKYNKDWQPDFYPKTISNSLDMPLNDVKYTISDLTGILCEKITDKGYLYFLPNSRLKLVEEMIVPIGMELPI